MSRPWRPQFAPGQWVRFSSAWRLEYQRGMACEVLDANRTGGWDFYAVRTLQRDVYAVTAADIYGLPAGYENHVLRLPEGRCLATVVKGQDDHDGHVVRDSAGATWCDGRRES